MKNSDYTFQYFIDSFEQAKVVSTDLITTSDSDLLFWKPTPEKWSMVEILSHLVEAGNEYLPQINKALNKPDEKLTLGTEPFTPNFAFRWFIKQVSPQNPKKLPTVSSFKPEIIEKLNSAEVLDEFIHLQNAFLHIIKKAKLEGLDLDKIKARNPIIKIVPMSLTACFGVTDAHQRRHFGQMRALKELFNR